MRHRKRKKSGRQMIAAACMVVLAAAALIVLMSSKVFSVRDIMVVGNRNLTAEDVIAQSGLKKGDNYLRISGARLKERLEKNRYIEYLGYGFDYKGVLTIRINERLGNGFVKVNGLYYVIDEKGMVLEQKGGLYPEGLTGIEIAGLTMDSHAVLVEGQIFPVQDKVKLEIMESLIGILEETSLIGRISQINLNNTRNIALTTSDGAKIELGDSSSLRTKILIAREVITIREQVGDLMGAKIDVSTGKDAHYIPASLPTPTPVPTATPGPTITPEPT